MIKTKNTQSLTHFRANALKTLERLDETGLAEIITVNGKAAAVLLSPAVFDELGQEIEIASVVTQMRKSLQEVGEGAIREGTDWLDALRDQLRLLQSDSAA